MPRKKVIAKQRIAAGPPEQRVVSSIRNALKARTNPLLVRNDEYLANLLCLIRKHYHRSSGAGLSASVAREDVVIDMLISALKRQVTRTPPNPKVMSRDADFYVGEIAVSFKVIASPNGGGFALSWSKNPGGSQNRKFQAIVTLGFFAPPTSSKRRRPNPWDAMERGFYVFSMTQLRRAKFGSNNKSDTLVDAPTVVRWMQASKAAKRFVALTIRDVPCACTRISLWELCGTAFEKNGATHAT